MGRAARTVLRGVLLGVLLSLAGQLAPWGTVPASAHSTLVESRPAAGSTIDAPLQQVRLRFDEPVATGHALVTVTGPGGVQVQTGRAVVDGTSVVQGLRPVRAGRYRVAYRLSSVSDGHPVLGALHFDVAVDDPAAARESDTGSVASAGPADGSAHTATRPGWALAGLGALLVLLGGRSTHRSERVQPGRPRP